MRRSAMAALSWMVAGGAEERVSEAVVFDTLFATSTRNDHPGELTPRP